MNIEKYLLGFVLLSVFVVAGLFVLNNINMNYEEFGANLSNSSFNATYNSIATTYNISQEMNNQITASDITEGSIAEKALQGAITATSQIKSTYNLFWSLMNDLAKALHIPSFFFTFAITAITIMATFALIAIILRYNPL